MCWCTPSIRTPVCGKINCVPPGAVGRFGPGTRAIFVSGLELRTDEKLRALFHQLHRDSPERFIRSINTDATEIWLDPIEHEVLT